MATDVMASERRVSRAPPPAQQVGGGAAVTAVALADLLRRQILMGALRCDEPLPSERELGAHYGMARGAVRRAMAVLAREGLIVRYRGAGSFVSHTTAPPASDEIVRGDVRALTNLASVWTSEGAGRASPAEALALALAPHAGVCRFRQLVRAGHVSAVARASIPSAQLSRVGTVEGALRCALGGHGAPRGLLLHRVRSIRLPLSVAREFVLPTSHVALFIERLAFSPDGEPILRSSHYLRGDRFELLMSLGDDAEPVQLRP